MLVSGIDDRSNPAAGPMSIQTKTYFCVPILALALAACAPAPLQNLWRNCASETSAYWAEAGDANGDGYADLLVGACCGGGAQLFLGSAQGLGTGPSWTFKGGGPGALTGLCVGFAGHLAGPAAQVIFVSSPRDAMSGSVFLFRCGPSGPEAKPWKVLHSPSRGEGFGEQVIAAGDLNGDGYDDLAVADFGFGGARGKVYVYYGGPDGPHEKPDWSAEGEAAGDWFGYSMASVDLDGDGIPDLVITSKNCSGACATWLAGDPRFELHRQYLRTRADNSISNTGQTGRAYVFYGGRGGLQAMPGLTQEGEEPHASFGFRALALPGLEGNNRACVALSSPGWQANRGKVEIFEAGKRGEPLRKIWEMEGSAQDQNMGYILGLGPDFDSTGRPSLLVGSEKANLIDVYPGREGGFETAVSRQISGKDAGGRWGALCGSMGLPGKGSQALYSLVDELPTEPRQKPKGCVAVFSTKAGP
jgi:hypothetical protein